MATIEFVDVTKTYPGAAKGAVEHVSFTVPSGDICMLVQRIGEGPARVHIDIHTSDLEAEVARLEQAGATRVQEAHGWWIMRDPAGLVFCVVPDPPGTLTEDNAQRWD